jgi:hypothetical protein
VGRLRRATLRQNSWTCVLLSTQGHIERYRHAGGIFRRQMADSDRSTSPPWRTRSSRRRWLQS